MSILVDFQIREKIKNGEIKVDPFDESLINPNSLDIRLGNRFTEVVATDGISVDPSNPSSFRCIPMEAERFLLSPGSYMLASMYEDVFLADNICCELRGKSSLGRLGIINSDGFAGWVDGGWQGNLTMEIANLSSYPVLLHVGMKIGQLTFYQTDTPEKSYKKTGRYLNQAKGQGSLGVNG